MLPDDHPLRNQLCVFKGHRFEFRNHEVRHHPPMKTTQDIFNYATMAKQRDVEHYLGQKGFPMYRSLAGWRYEKFNLLEWMHNLARTFDNYQNLLVGKPDDPNFDRRARVSSQKLGVFRSVWEQKYLSQVRQQLLTNLDDPTIASADPTFCRRWLRVCGITPPRNTRVNELRINLTQLRDMASRGERVPVVGSKNPLPWRLSPAAKIIVNRRVVGISYPHYTPVCHIGKESFIKRQGTWRTASKLIALLIILVPVTRGFVPKFRKGLRSLVWGLRILEGQTFSINEMMKINIGTCTGKALKKSEIVFAKRLIIEGLAMIEGCCPVRILVPATHCLTHYGDGALTHGLLRLLWMISFGKLLSKMCGYMISLMKINVITNVLFCREI